MSVTVELPDDLTQHPNAAREALEALAIDAYRSGAMTHFQASHLLGLSRLEFEGFLKSRGILEGAYGFEDLQADLGTIQRRLARDRRWRHLPA